MAPPLCGRGGRLHRGLLRRAFGGILLFLTSCTASLPLVTQPRTTAVPVAFQNPAADTTAIARLSWQKFFADSALVSLIDTGLRANPDLGIALQRVEQARAGLLYARGVLLPQVSAGVATSIDKFADYSGVGNSVTYDGRRQLPGIVPDLFVGFRSTWEIDLWGKLRSRRKAAYARLLATEQGRRLVQTSLVAQVASSYYELLTYDNQLAVLEKNRAYQERALEVVKIQKLGGRATELAVQQFAAQLLRTRSLAAEARQRIAAAENTINRLLGRYPQPIRRGRALTMQTVPAAVSAGLPATMLLRRPDVQQAELQLTAARADVAAARAAFLPSLTLAPYLGMNAYTPALLLSAPGSLAYGLLAGVAAPVFNRSAVRANYAHSAAEQRAAYLNYQKTIQTGFEEVTTNLRGLENYREVADLRQQEVNALTNAVATANDLYRANYATYIEVITAQRSVLDAELNLTAARRQQFLLLIDLYRALGGGWTAAQ